MTITLGTSSGNKDLSQVWVGTSGGNKQVLEVWVGTSGGNKQVFSSFSADASTTLADMERQRQIEQAFNSARAVKNNAFGGTGAEVAAGLTNENYARQMASTAAGLRSQGYTTALSAAQADAARKLQADTSNQGYDWQTAALNAGNEQQAGMFNAQAGTDAARYGADQAYGAQIANQQAAQSAAQTGLSSASLLSQLSDQQRSQAMGDAGLLSQVGDAQYQQQQAQLTAAYDAWLKGQELSVQQQQLLNQATGLIPDYGTQASTGTGVSKGSQSGIGFSFTYGGKG